MSNIISVPDKITKEVAESEIDILIEELGLDGKNGVLPELIIEDTKNKKFSINGPVMDGAIKKCDIWINSHKQIIKNMQNFIKIKKTTNNLDEESNMQWETIRKNYETSLKKGYAILQYIYRIVTGAEEKKYLVYVEGKDGYFSQEIELDISEMLNSVALTFKQNIDDINLLSNMIGNSALTITRKNITSKLRKTTDLNDEEKHNLKQTEEYLTMISDIYTANAKQTDKNNKDYNNGRAYEILKTVIFNGKENKLQSLLKSHKRLLKKDKNYLANELSFENNGKKSSFTKATRKKEESLWGVKNFVTTATSLFRKYQIDNIPSYANSGDVGGYELKYMSAKNDVNLNNASVIVSGVVRALQRLKALKAKSGTQILGQLKKGKTTFLQGTIEKNKMFKVIKLDKEYQKVYDELMGLIDLTK